MRGVEGQCDGPGAGSSVGDSDGVLGITGDGFGIGDVGRGRGVAGDQVEILFLLDGEGFFIVFGQPRVDDAYAVDAGRGVGKTLLSVGVDECLIEGLPVRKNLV